MGAKLKAAEANLTTAASLPRLMTARQQYAVSVHLLMPETPLNEALGMFQVRAKRLQGLRCRIWSSRYRMLGSGFRVWGWRG